MTYARRFAFALAVTFALSLTNARAQTPSVSTVNVTPDEQKVRIAAVGDALDVRVTVSDESGDVVFESGPATGDHLDWTMRDAQEHRVPPGSYALTVTYRTSSGKLKRRVEQVVVTEEVTGEAKQESAAPTPAAPVEGAGNAGKLAKFTAANSVGNSVMTESASKIGVNTAAPTHTLTIFGGPKWTTGGWTGSVALPNAGAIGWAANSAGQRRGIGQNNGGLYFFRTTSNPGTAVSVAVPDLVINNAGNVGVGTTTPAARLTVNGGIQILGSGNGIKFADGSIQTKATAGTINGTGTTNRLAKFTGPNSFGNSSVAEVSGRVGIGTSSPAVNLQVQGGGVTEAQVRSTSERAILSLDSTIDGGNRVWTLENGVSGVPGLFGIFDRTASLPRLVIDTNGNVGIGRTPTTKLDINGSAQVDALVAAHVEVGGLSKFEYLAAPQGSVVQMCRDSLNYLTFCSSSLRYKTDLRPFLGGLSLINRLNPITYRWKGDGALDLGLGAEEVAEVEPLLTFKNEKGEVEGVKYDRLSAAFINAFKEQQAQIQQQQKLIGRLQSRLTRLERAKRRGCAARK